MTAAAIRVRLMVVRRILGFQSLVLWVVLGGDSEALRHLLDVGGKGQLVACARQLGGCKRQFSTITIIDGEVLHYDRPTLNRPPHTLKETSSLGESPRDRSCDFQ